jgi:hypothetical protein
VVPGSDKAMERMSDSVAINRALPSRHRSKLGRVN